MSSFSAEVKNELARANNKKSCCDVAELASLLRMGGNLLIGTNKSFGINFTTENAAIARKTLTLIKQSFNLKTEVMVSRARRLKKNNSYLIRVVPEPRVSELLTLLGILQGESFNAGKDKGILRKNCCKRSYLKGAFLGGGSVSKPESDYHLELVTGSFSFAETIVNIMKSFNLPVRLTDRKNDYIIYLKDGEAIISFLRNVGANSALLDFENVRVVKEMRNQINRIVNCETANLQKTVNASFRQVEKIKLIDKIMGLDNLPDKLKEVARLRLSFPEATLQELVACNEHKISKSGINHRLRKLEEIAISLTKDEMNEKGKNK